MSTQFSTLAQFESEVSAALLRAAQLAREDAIKTNTGIVVSKNGQIIEITADELKNKHKGLNQ